MYICVSVFLPEWVAYMPVWLFGCISVWLFSHWLCFGICINLSLSICLYFLSVLYYIICFCLVLSCPVLYFIGLICIILFGFLLYFILFFVYSYCFLFCLLFTARALVHSGMAFGVPYQMHARSTGKEMRQSLQITPGVYALMPYQPSSTLHPPPRTTAPMPSPFGIDYPGWGIQLKIRHICTFAKIPIPGESGT